ncbi:MAG: hypothetical protein KGR16_05080 [Verrucomicrobia bacterium]|nr:hypothetical protein [Verrucomicrobiota bacterium]MDE3046866.1 hypothetical protein [Verrucomicrobiota bacterium]
MTAPPALHWSLQDRPDRIRDLIQASNVEVIWATKASGRGGYWHTLDIVSNWQYIGAVSVLWDQGKIVTKPVIQQDDPRFEPMREFFCQLLQYADSSLEASRLFEWYRDYPPPVMPEKPGAA